MNYELLEYTVQCSELGDTYKVIAIGSSRQALEGYLKNTLGKSLEKDKSKPFDDYYVIRETDVRIVTNEAQETIQGAEEEHY